MAEPETKKESGLPKNKEVSPFSDYLEKIKDRAKKTRIRTKHQMIGLEIADILGDRKHKALYMKIAKNGIPDEALIIAKSIAENGNVKNKGAYFMRVWSESKKKITEPKKSSSVPRIKKRKNGNSHGKKQTVGDLEALDAFL